MIGSALTKVFGTSNERAVKRLLPVVQSVNALESEIQRLSDDELRAKTQEFKAESFAIHAVSLYHAVLGYRNRDYSAAT